MAQQGGVAATSRAEIGAEWRRAVALDRLRRDGKAVAKIAGKQIALFASGGRILACNNRCPHEGYPLAEGTLAEASEGACVLTCNWHNWKFDLATGDNLYGGDNLRVYPTRIIEGEIWVDVADPPAAERQAQAYEHLRAGFEDDDYDRMARELARLAKAGGDPAEVIAEAIEWSHNRMQYGMTHAYAAASGWLRLYDQSRDPELRLACIVEAVGYISFDVVREPSYPFAPPGALWDAAGFFAAVEAQDEALAIGHLRRALADGRGFAELEPALTEAALAHYAGFGHSLIYITHAGDLIARLGRRVEVPLVLALTRALIYARREDLIPEFRTYADTLAGWPRSLPADGRGTPAMDDLRGRSAAATMAAVAEAASHAPPLSIYPQLLGAASLNLLQFDIAWQEKTDSSIAQNVGWLDFTHGLTFASAVRKQCGKFPALWPAGLLQLACFVGRNTGFTTPAETVGRWRVADRRAFADRALARLCDHGEDRYILAAHLLKTYLAAESEVAAGLPADIEDIVLASVNRLLAAPLKRKHVRRTVHQALEFVALEG